VTDCSANNPQLSEGMVSSGQHAVVTANCGKGQTDFSKKTKLFRPAKNIANFRRVWLHHRVPSRPPVQQPTENRARLRIYYSGRVQGVGFRYTVKRVAAGFEVTGCIRNLPDGRVELTAEGARGELEAFRAAIRAEGLAGFIQGEEVIWGVAENEFHGFEISR
jgi:acylphosphatase